MSPLRYPSRRTSYQAAASLTLFIFLIAPPCASSFHVAVGPTATDNDGLRCGVRMHASPPRLKAALLELSGEGVTAEESLSRRDVLRSGIVVPSSTVAAVTSLVPILSGSPPAANAAQTAGEAVRRSAANLPGYGQADVFYPPYFRGVWRATREVVSSDEVPLASLVPATIGYEVRFVPVDGNGGSAEGGGSSVVADRGYNERSYREAVRALATAAKADSAPNPKDTVAPRAPPAVREARWDASNPNVLSLAFVDGSTEEIKVTKRAVEAGPNGDTLFSSEFRRVTTTVGERGVPSIRGNRVLTKWRRVGEGVVEGIEIVYGDAAVLGDPMGGGPIGVGLVPQSPSTGPQISGKSRIRLEKL